MDKYDQMDRRRVVGWLLAIVIGLGVGWLLSVTLPIGDNGLWVIVGMVAACGAVEGAWHRKKS